MKNFASNNFWPTLLLLLSHIFILVAAFFIWFAKSGIETADIIFLSNVYLALIFTPLVMRI